MQDLKMKDQITGHEKAGHEIEEPSTIAEAFVVSCEQTCADMKDDNCWACDTIIVRNSEQYSKITSQATPA